MWWLITFFFGGLIEVLKTVIIVALAVLLWVTVLQHLIKDRTKEKLKKLKKDTATKRIVYIFVALGLLIYSIARAGTSDEPIKKWDYDKSLEHTYTIGAEDEKDRENAIDPTEDRPSDILHDMGNIKTNTLAGEVLLAHMKASKGDYSTIENSSGGIEEVPIWLTLGINVTETGKYKNDQGKFLPIPFAGMPYEVYGKLRGDGTRITVNNWTTADAKKYGERVSYAGAVGPMQQLPSTWNGGRHRDGNADGVKDINNLFDVALGAADWYRSESENINTKYQLGNDPDMKAYYFAGIYHAGAGNWSKYVTKYGNVVRDDVRKVLNDKAFEASMKHKYLTRSHGYWDLSEIALRFAQEGWKMDTRLTDIVEKAGYTVKPEYKSHITSDSSNRNGALVKNGMTFPFTSFFYPMRMYLHGQALLPYLYKEGMTSNIQKRSGIFYYGEGSSQATTRGDHLEIGYSDNFPIYRQSDTSIYSYTYMYSGGKPRSMASVGCTMFAVTSLLHGMGYSSDTLLDFNIDLDKNGVISPTELFNSGVMGNTINHASKTSTLPLINGGSRLRNPMGLEIKVARNNSKEGKEMIKQDLLNGHPWLVRLINDQKTSSKTKHALYQNEEGKFRKLVSTTTHFIVLKDAFVGKDGRVYVNIVNSTNNLDTQSFNSIREAYLFDDLLADSGTDYNHFTIKNWGGEFSEIASEVNKNINTEIDDSLLIDQEEVVRPTLHSLSYEDIQVNGMTRRRYNTRNNNQIRIPYEGVIFLTEKDGKPIRRIIVSQTQYIEIIGITNWDTNLKTGDKIEKGDVVGIHTNNTLDVVYGTIIDGNKFENTHWIMQDYSEWVEE